MLKIQEKPEDKNAGGIPLGDVVLNLDTSNVEQSVNRFIEKLQLALVAFKAEWNR